MYSFRQVWDSPRQRHREYSPCTRTVKQRACVTSPDKSEGQSRGQLFYIKVIILIFRTLICRTLPERYHSQKLFNVQTYCQCRQREKPGASPASGMLSVPGQHRATPFRRLKSLGTGSAFKHQENQQGSTAAVTRRRGRVLARQVWADGTGGLPPSSEALTSIYTNWGRFRTGWARPSKQEEKTGLLLNNLDFDI